MRRPSEGTVALVDKMVADLDAATIDESVNSHATSSYAVIVDEWERFKALIDALDGAVERPFADGAAAALRQAESLVDSLVHRLAFWLTHVGAAIQGS